MDKFRKDFNIMGPGGKPFNLTVFRITVKDFETYRKDFDAQLVDICVADPTRSLDAVKRSLRKVFHGKAEKQKHGMIAEFFVHYFLRGEGFKQQFLFFNLEEGSMKKAFDGLFSKDEDYWLVESKSSYAASTHKHNVSEALNDLKDKVNGEASNNPWQNAANHMKALENGAKNETIFKKIKKLCNDFDMGTFTDTGDHSLIPCSTLFAKLSENDEDIVDAISKEAEKSNAEKMIVLCIENAFYDEFEKYFEG